MNFLIDAREDGRHTSNLLPMLAKKKNGSERVLTKMNLPICTPYNVIPVAKVARKELSFRRAHGYLPFLTTREKAYYFLVLHFKLQHVHCKLLCLTNSFDETFCFSRALVPVAANSEYRSQSQTVFVVFRILEKLSHLHVIKTNVYFRIEA